MEKNKKLEDRGITLIALIVTIIVLLILAGVSIAVLTGENGIINRTSEAKTTSKVSEVEEQARLIYTDYLIGHKAHNEALADLDTICAELEDKGYPTKVDPQGGETINGIKTTPETLDNIPTSTDADTLVISSTAAITDKKTIEVEKDSISGDTAKYYAVVDGKDYEMTLTNGVVNISRVPTTGASNTAAALTNVTASVSPTGIIDVNTNGDNVEISRNPNATGGTAIITITGTINGTIYTQYAKISIKAFASTETSYVGYYADLNNDGNITEDDDGRIFVDLARPAKASRGLGQSYSYTRITSGLKDYILETTKLNGDGNDVNYLKLDNASVGSTNLADRFYVLGLKDIEDSSNNTTLYWYYNAYKQSTYTGKMKDYDSTGNNNTGSPTSTAFGKGIDNTITMMEKRSLTSTDQFYYGDPNPRDVWEYVTSGWFIPSKEEWASFAGELGVTSSNYSSFELSACYWSSSQASDGTAWDADFSTNSLSTNGVMFGRWVRLAAIF